MVVPVRVMRDEIANGLARRIAVTDPVKPHRVSICYQTGAFGAGIGSVMTLTRKLIMERRLLLPLSTADRHLTS